MLDPVLKKLEVLDAHCDILQMEGIRMGILRLAF